MNQNDIRATKKFIANTLTSTQNMELHFTNEECTAFFQSISANPFTANHFYFALKLPSYSMPFQHNCNSFFGKEINTLEDFLAQVHPDYLGAFLEWAKSAHLMIASHPEYLIVLETAYKIMVPLQNAEGKYYWILQESYPLQVSNDGQMLAQFNTYTVVSKYDKPQEMIGWVSGKMGLNSEQDSKLKYFFNKISTFTLTNKERELIKTVQNLPEMPYREIAQIQNVQDATIKQHAKNITKKAKDAFPHFFKKEDVVTLKSVASYLHQLDFDHEDEAVVPGESA